MNDKRGQVRLAKVDGELFLMIDGSTFKKPLNRVTVDAVKGEPVKLYVEFDIPDTGEVVGTYDELNVDLSSETKAKIAIEVLNNLQPEDVEHVLATLSDGPMGYALLDTLSNYIGKQFITGGAVDGNEERPGPDVRDGSFPPVFG